MSAATADSIPELDAATTLDREWVDDSGVTRQQAPARPWRHNAKETAFVVWKGNKRQTGVKARMNLAQAQTICLIVPGDDPDGLNDTDVHSVGRSYDFKQGEVTRVHKDDVQFLLHHWLFNFEEIKQDTGVNSSTGVVTLRTAGRRTRGG